MRLLNSTRDYGAIAQTLHWLTAVLVVLAWGLGQVGEDLGGDGPSAPGILAHVFVGLAVLVLLVLRVAWRLYDAPPVSEPTPLGLWAERVATLTHYILLVLLVAAPIAGIAYQFARGESLPVFGLIEIASPLSLTRAAARTVKEVHEVLANALLFVAIAHAAAGLFHHWVLRDRVLKRMWPFAD